MFPCPDGGFVDALCCGITCCRLPALWVAGQVGHLLDTVAERCVVMERRPCGWCIPVVGMVFILALVSCGDRGGVSIAVAPTEVTLAPGETQVFTATVMGDAGTGVMWSSSGGELVASGVTETFTAPAEVGEYAVTATSAQDQGRWASAVVTVEAPAGTVVLVAPIAPVPGVGVDALMIVTPFVPATESARRSRSRSRRAS